MLLIWHAEGKWDLHRIPTVDIYRGQFDSGNWSRLQDDFVYLGKRFNSNMCLEVSKTNVINKLHDLIAKITNIGIKPQSKIKLLKLMIYPI